MIRRQRKRGLVGYYIKLENSIFIPLRCKLPSSIQAVLYPICMRPHSGSRGGQGQEGQYGNGN